MNTKGIFSTFLSAAILLAAVTALSSDTPQDRFLKELNCTRALIVNADDLGRTAAGNEGILKGFREGIVTSTSLMTPALAAGEAYKLIEKNPGLDVGVHFILARDDAPDNFYGPLTKGKSLTDENGWFFTNIDTIIRQGDKKEIADELYAQVKAAYDHNVDVTHLDCHKGFYHTYDPKSLTATLKLARKYDLPIRWVGAANDPKLTKNGIVVTNYLTGVAGDTPHEDKKARIIEILKGLKPGITEIYFHPAANGWIGGVREERQSELDIVTDPDIKKLIQDEKICLIGYRDLRNFQRKLRSEEKTSTE